MASIDRRQFLGAAGLAPWAAMAAAKPRIGLVQSSHRALAKPVSPDHPLDYERVRDMVWKAIEYAGAPRIPAGSWVVIKPNLGFLRPQPSYCPGDITDMRVTRAVLEYAARYSAAGRVTIAEGGSYRGVRDPAPDSSVTQGGRRVDALDYEWDPGEYPGFAGSVGGMLREMTAAYPAKKFDYVNLNDDGIRDAAGALRRIPVPAGPNGMGAFGARPDYFVTNTITRCDFLIVVPVMKIHNDCGLTACLKNYVGTAPREAYAVPGRYWNVLLHGQHSVEQRIDHFIADLASFHPPDYVVVDAIRGLQYSEHALGRPDQMIRSNLVMASRDPVAADALAAHLIGFQPWDIDYLHMGERRGMGTAKLAGADVAGDDPARLRARWGKPRNWFGRCNREWLVTAAPETPMASWKRETTRADTLQLAGGSGAAAVRVIADGARKAYLWVGVRGRVAAELNGERVMEEENLTRYRVAQFQKPVELRSGENRLVFRVAAPEGPARLSALLTGERNDGDTVDGIRWEA